MGEERNVCIMVENWLKPNIEGWAYLPIMQEAQGLVSSSANNNNLIQQSSEKAVYLFLLSELGFFVSQYWY